MVLVNLILFVLAGAVLVLSGTLLVKSLTKIGGYLHVSEFVSGFIIMAMATSVPELFVGISSALEGNEAIALGNVIGANILNLTIVIGIVALLKRGIKMESSKTKKDALYMVFIAALPLVLMWIGHEISRTDAIILIAALLVYARKLYKERKVFSKGVEKSEGRWTPVLYTLLFVLSLALLFISSRFLVKYATLLSIELMLHPILIGLFMVSIGTTLPELVFESRAALMSHSEMAMGNMIGSVIVNSTLVLGVTALISPIHANFFLFLTSGAFMLLVAFLFATFIESGNKLRVKEAISLILLYLFFIMIEFYVKGMVP